MTRKVLILLIVLLFSVQGLQPQSGHAGSAAVGAGSEAAGPGNSYVLFTFPNGSYLWYEAAAGQYTNAFNLTLAGASRYGLAVNYTSSSFGVFVNSIGGIGNNLTSADGPYWTLWVWNSSSYWEVSQYGATNVSMPSTAAVAWSYSIWDQSSGLPAWPPQESPLDMQPVASSRGGSGGTGSTVPAQGNAGAPPDHLSWQARTASGGIDVQPVDWNGIAYVVTDGSGNASSVIAYSNSGVQLWHQQIGSLGYELAAPLAVAGLLVVPSTDGAVYTFNATTGRELGRTVLSSSPYGLTSSPVLGPDGYFILNCSGGLDYVAFNGSLRWSAPAGNGSYYASPSYADGVVYAFSNSGNGSTLYAFDAAGGALEWSRNFSGTVYGTPSAVQGSLYFVMAVKGTAGGGYSAVYAYRLEDNGTTDWVYQAGPSAASPSSTAVGEGCVVFAYSNLLVELNASSGRMLWESTDNNEFASPSPYIYGGYIVSSTNANHSHLLVTTLQGQPVWNYSVAAGGDYSLCSPVYNGTSLLWGDDAGNVYDFQSLNVTSAAYTQDNGTVHLTAAPGASIAGPVNFSWEVNGTTLYGANVSYTFGTNGTYSATVTLSYSANSSAAATIQVVVDTVTQQGAKTGSGQGHGQDSALLAVYATAAAAAALGSGAVIAYVRRRRR